jgi:hypothetical protein
MEYNSISVKPEFRAEQGLAFRLGRGETIILSAVPFLRLLRPDGTGAALAFRPSTSLAVRSSPKIPAAPPGAGVGERTSALP